MFSNEKKKSLTYNRCNKYSIVAYGFGYHVDVFGKKLPFLENKAIVSVPFMKKYYVPGRVGRYGHKTFPYALWDWGNK